MVVRIDSRPKKKQTAALPLFDRLEAIRPGPLRVRLTAREIEHRKRMLEHLSAQRRAAQ
jgi:hypothetical protein